MNAGKIVKSAKHDSKVPCTYEDCTRGFTKEVDMKRHKDEDHEWCRLCNVDCADDEALLEHKVQSEMHICCDFCGEDFRSEKGKERHMRQVSSYNLGSSLPRLRADTDRITPKCKRSSARPVMLFSREVPL